MNRLLFFIILFPLVLFGSVEDRPGFNFESLGQIAIQHRGRIKPLDTFASESLQFVTGKKSWKGKGAVECLVGWLFNFDREWENEEIIRVTYKPLKAEMGLGDDKNYFSFNQLQDNEGLKRILKSAATKSRNRERLSDLEKKAVTVENQLGLIGEIFTGQAFAILPNPEGISASWYPITNLNTQGGLPYASDVTERFAITLKESVEAFLNKNAQGWNASVPRLISMLSEDMAKGSYPEKSVLKREIHYNRLRPFRVSWGLYTVGFIFLMVFIVGKRKMFQNLGLGAVILGLLVHTYGFTLRCLIAGRPPVTNMYESVIWVTWGCVLFS
ncbi:MAG: hypothetical protein ACKOA8_08830, partial [Deltaproteobacteria bacterium]